MRYGRTLTELLVAQAFILTAFLVVPYELVELAGIAGGTALALVVACALLLRHHGRGAAHACPSAPTNLAIQPASARSAIA